jgi:hypothetical protein
MQTEYIQTGVLKTIIQDLPQSQNTDVVEIQIVRVSDGYLWDFTNSVFVPLDTVNTTGIMTSIRGTFWQATFTPNQDDIYLISVDDTTIDSQSTQSLTSVATTAPSIAPAPVTPSTGVQALIDTAKKFMPVKFLVNCDDTKIEAFLNLVVDDINATSPFTAYTLENLPQGWSNIVCFGSQTFANLFLQSTYALNDFSYSDNGLSLTVDRQARLSPVYEKSLANYNIMKQNLKKAMAVSTGARILVTNNWTSVIGMSQFINSIFPGTITR